MTERIDPQGRKLQFEYDEDLRLIRVHDALAHVTTLSYEHPEDEWKITRVQDPFGRFATFQYDGEGRLETITDVIGLSASFTYDGDTITSMTTPYGTTSFALTVEGRRRVLDVVDPLGGRERVEFTNDPIGIPASDPVDLVPQEPPGTPGILFADQNNRLAYRSTYYWDKRATERFPGDYTKAVQYHWLHHDAYNITAGVVESIKKPLENRVWYLYPNQYDATHSGDSDRPIRAGRVLDDGTSQIRYYEYNSRGKTIKAIDPLGRETVYVYGSANVPDADPAEGTGIDLLAVKQKNPAALSGYDLLNSYTYNDKHQVLTATDAAGQTTTYIYTADGLIETITTPPTAANPAGMSTTYAYHPETRRLDHVENPGGRVTSYTYDAYGRVRTVTDDEGYVLTMDYDDLDRLTRTTVALHAQ